MKKTFILLITILLLPKYVLAQEIDKDYLDSQLSMINDSYTFDNDSIEQNLLEEINHVVTDENIEKDIHCNDNICSLVLRYNEIFSEEKEIEIIINTETVVTNEIDENEEIIENEENDETINNNEIDLNNSAPINEETELIIKTQSHIQDIGWTEEDTTLTLGTTGKNKKLEAFRILVENMDGNIEYLSFIGNLGWEDCWKQNGDVSGTTGRNLRIEALKIRLTGNISNEYDIYYRVHVQNIGWLGWTKNEEIAGSFGYGYNIEAIEIKLLEKSNQSIEISNSFLAKEGGLHYTSHNQDVGWQEYVEEGESGQPGNNKQLEAIKIKLVDYDYSGNIEYSAHVENIGWQDYRSNGEIAGTTGKNQQIEALKINLTGELAEVYDIYYRVYNRKYGWLGWGKNGDVAGTTGMAIPLDGYELKLVEKGTGSGEVTGNSEYVREIYLTYQTHVENIGNQEYREEGEIAGTTGRALWVEGIRIKLESTTEGTILYKTSSRKKGWEEDYIENGDFSGTTGEGREIQLIRIKLEGEIADKYDIYYRVHTSNYGWLGWAKNDEEAGVNHYSIEAIQIKLYLKDDPAINNINTDNHYIEYPEYKPSYYNQKDSSWANINYGGRKFGSTGCVATSLAMAYTGILLKNIFPNEVGDYLYYKTDEYNKKASGASGQAIILASNYYDVNCNPLLTEEDIIEALTNRKIVYAVMGDGKYATTRYNHAIIMFEYKNGETYVYDPLRADNNGWVTIEQLLDEQSKDPDDSTGGSNFYSLERF